MIIVNLKGGLGNQMFQYAAGRRLAEVCSTELKLDLNFLEHEQQKANVTLRKYELEIFNIKAKLASTQEILKYKNTRNKILRKLLPGYKSNPYIKERHFHVDETILSLNDNKYLDGHWMSERYFEDVMPLIRSEFTFKRPVLKQAEKIRSRIEYTNSVCVQVRRGDYVTNSKIAKVHQTISPEYFYQAMVFIGEKVENPVYFVFSDDIQWCQEHFSGMESICFVEKELRETGADNNDYLQLMTLCKYFIISNSTFGWWGAWLSHQTDKIIIAPRNWFNSSLGINTKDIYPASWLQL